MTNFTLVPPPNIEDALNHASELLQCAAATAYESGDRLSGPDRHLVFSVMHLVELARTVIDQSVIKLEKLA
ncbi:DUF3077 domain-containing protein [Pseudomonas sp. G.S.17]|uniref:DUF6124 family protein n=1 Tax=Pseudomonas sp. G.S.17 TaxID=3137451 RepID=UPI00311CC5E4